MASPAKGKRAEARVDEEPLIEPEDQVDPKTPKRINVAVTPEALRGIEQVIANEGVTLTEAVRRLLNYGHFVYEQVKERGGELELTTADGVKKDVVFI